jgi:hypothetical protein
MFAVAYLWYAAEAVRLVGGAAPPVSELRLSRNG